MPRSWWCGRLIDAWIAAAVAVNATVEVVNLPRHQHGFDGRDDDDESRRVIRQTIDFFARHLAPPRLRGRRAVDKIRRCQ